MNCFPGKTGSRCQSLQVPGTGCGGIQRAGTVRPHKVSEDGERIPITIADVDRNEGTITLIIQSVGKTTLELAGMKPGDSIPDIAGPLGETHPH